MENTQYQVRLENTISGAFKVNILHILTVYNNIIKIDWWDIIITYISCNDSVKIWFSNMKYVHASNHSNHGL